MTSTPTSTVLGIGDELDGLHITEAAGPNVYVGYDRELDRKVTIKLLGTPGEVAADAHVPSAIRALARLNHRNVVGVYRVGVTEAAGVYVAMEYAGGRSLRGWLQESRRIADILEVFVDVGRGLAAGHRAGLVHGDFSLDTALVGDDRRGRVSDLGLLALPANAASLARDQRAFCAAFYEALYGARPIAGRSLSAVTTWAERVPRQLQRTLQRGLGPAAQAFGSMQELLDALTPRRSRWWLAAGATTAAAITLLAWRPLASQSHEAASPMCVVEPALLAGVWDATLRADLSTSFARVDRAYVAATTARVLQRLDDYANVWLVTHADTCAATHHRGEQSAEVLDLRMRCLHGLRTNLGALVGELAQQPTPAILIKSVDAVAELRPASECADVRILRASSPLPAHPAHRALVRDGQAQLARAWAMQQLGRAKRALELARAAGKTATAADYAPLEAEALYVEGAVTELLGKYADAAKVLERAATAAGRARDDRLLAKGLIKALVVVGSRQRDANRGRALAEAAEAAVARADHQPELRADLANARAMALITENKFAQALPLFRTAAAIYAELSGPRSLRTMKVMGNVAIAQVSLGQAAAAGKTLHQVIASLEELLGPSHPSLATKLNSLAAVFRRQGKTDQAIAAYLRALKILEGAYGSKHPHIAAVLTNYATALSASTAPGTGEKVLALQQRALAIRRAVYGPDHPRTAQSLANVGSALGSLGRIGEARAALSKALALFERKLGPNHAQVGSASEELGDLARRQRDYAVAIKQCSRGYDIVKATAGESNPLISFSSMCVGMSYVGLGKYREASPFLERSYKIEQPKGLDIIGPMTLATLEFDLAKTRWHTQSPSQRPEIRALAALARKHFTMAGDRRAADVTTWLERAAAK